ncbi:Imidazoleglycerol-phosphate dehydratase [Candidatus Desulforudis audaxviator MP104C]|uniref:Imidazoleglycerol-phosphate dehydratase n=1 Tax=Desulforudis audaxviator (strain MP104C) TaxID=477974 RepID=HIS7_DESAP|nr:imidazoleglycerol-phosphate dehydratase HisB [Candidatus Desulforudis audaxviator]B1I559.1 RecName: Full=Imidazoleglycerol-phosphate dehydratase; Short=IGPD [Candidatus Desulforudis audaxviator MP104C]ACA60127.1 Imidazoleglycerol-phosphate dehydratase [Candidatus Desulforudis audaxviator MP104C]
MLIRKAEVRRQTRETEIRVQLQVDGTGEYALDTGVPFLEHMLALTAKFSGFDLQIRARGDLDVDDHHTVEDVGICLGEALVKALGDKAGIGRFGHAIVPMDDALALVAVDLSGRGYLAFDVPMPSPQVGRFDTELVEEFLRALAYNGRFNLHVRLLAGANTHHIIEAVFKGLGVALGSAARINAQRGVPSTKGVIN